MARRPGPRPPSSREELDHYHESAPIEELRKCRLRRRTELSVSVAGAGLVARGDESRTVAAGAISPVVDVKSGDC